MSPFDDTSGSLKHLLAVMTPAGLSYIDPLSIESIEPHSEGLEGQCVVTMSSCCALNVLEPSETCARRVSAHIDYLTRSLDERLTEQRWPLYPVTGGGTH